MVMNLEMWVRFLGQEDPLEADIATHSSILARRIPWTEEPGEIQSTGSQRVRESDTTEAILHACNAMKILHATTKTQLSQINKY